MKIDEEDLTLLRRSQSRWSCSDNADAIDVQAVAFFNGTHGVFGPTENGNGNVLITTKTN